MQMQNPVRTRDLAWTVHSFIIWQEAGEDQSKPAWDLEAGMTLPFFYGDPPPGCRKTPLEELDPHFQSQKVDVDLH